jgi:multiple sugar transport system permease protein
MASQHLASPHLASRHPSRPGVPTIPKHIGRLLWWGVCIFLSILLLFPIVWSMISSLKTPAEAAAVPPTFLPSQISWENYTRLNEIGDGILQYAGNSVFVTLLTISGTIVLSTLAGYGFARFTFPYSGVTFILLLAPIMIPFQAIMIPLLLVQRTFGLQNSLLGLACIYITFQLPFSIFVMRNAFSSIPREIEEAALLDGCSLVRMLTRVMLPIVLPGIITVGVFTFLNAWNEYLAALIYLNKPSTHTLPLLLATARTNPGLFGGTNWGGLQAGVTVNMLPALILFMLLQRYYVRGLSSGAVK